MQDQTETVAPSVAQHAMSDHITALKSLIEWCEQKAAGTAHLPGWGSAFLRDLENMRERESRRLVRQPMRGGPYDGKFLLLDGHGCSGSVDMPGGTYYYVAQGDGVWVWSGLIDPPATDYKCSQTAAAVCGGILSIAKTGMAMTETSLRCRACGNVTIVDSTDYSLGLYDSVRCQHKI